MRQKFTFLLALLALQLSVQAQGFYTFSKTTGTYAQLTGATTLTTDLSLNSYGYMLPIGFKVYGANMGVELGIGRSGWTTAGTLDHFFAVDPFFSLDTLIPTGSNSGIFAKTETVGTETIVKVEWRNVNIKGHPATDSLNFQLWMYKNSQNIEFRYGPSNYTPQSDDSIFITTVFFEADFSKQYEGHTIYKAGGTDKDDTAHNSNAMYDGVPANGTIFRLTGSPTSIGAVQAKSIAKVYPNPITDKLTVELKDKADYVITNITGAVVLSGTGTGKTEIDMQSLTPGLYFLRAGEETIKLVKQ